MKSEFLTLILPTFNDTKIFDRLIYLENPIFCKTHGVKIIVCDDSTDQRVSERVKNITHYQYLNHKRTGNAVDNWNFGLNNTVSEYAWLLHHDEFIETEHQFAEIIRKIKQSECDVFILNLKKMNDGKVQNFRPKFVRKLALRFPNLLYIANQLGSPSVFIHRQTSYRYNRNLKWLVDVDFFVRYLKVYKAQFIDVPIFTDIGFHDSITNKIKNKNRLHIDELYLLNVSRWKIFILRIMFFLR